MPGIALLAKGDKTGRIPGGLALRSWTKFGIAIDLLSRLAGGVIILLLLAPGSASAYKNLGNNVLQSNGSASDTQAAINAATDGTIIQIANGSYTWSQQVSNNNTCVHIVAQSLGGVTISDKYTGGSMLMLKASPNGYVELSGINFNCSYTGSQNNYGYIVNIYQLSGLPILLHDCSFVTEWEYAVQWVGNGGVCWNCSFASTTDGLGGISLDNVSATCAPWNVSSSMGGARDSTGLNAGDPSGTLDTYVENCLFQDMDVFCSNLDDNSRSVFRYSTFNNAALGSHGQDTAPWGVRHYEVYGNTFNYSTSGTAFGGHPYPLNMQTWFTIRGGTGVVTNNAMQNIPYNKAGIQLNVFSINQGSAIACQTVYPAAHQIGQGWSPKSKATYGNPIVSQDGTGAVSDPLYIWNNTGTETTSGSYVG